MNNSVSINNKSVCVKKIDGIKVVSLKDIDAIHARPSGTARKRFNDNKRHFIEGEDFFVRKTDEAKKMGITAPNGVILLTESGYLMLAKSFTDDLAWKVQRELVKSYFRIQDDTPMPLPETTYEYHDKTWRGQPVMTTRDLEHFFGIRIDKIKYHAKRMRDGVDYILLTGNELAEYKIENGSYTVASKHVLLVTRSGFMKLAKLFGIEIETPKSFIEVQKPPVVTMNPTPSKSTQIKAFDNEMNDYITALRVLMKMKSESESTPDDKVMRDYNKLDAFACVRAVKMVSMRMAAAGVNEQAT